MSKFPRAGSVDPFDAVKTEMGQVVDNIKALLGVNHPLLSTVAKCVEALEAMQSHPPCVVGCWPVAASSRRERVF